MTTEVVDELISKNIFINQIDSFISSNVGRVALKSVFSNKINIYEDNEEDSEDEEKENEAILPSPSVNFSNNIFCTLSNPKYELKFASTVVKVSRK